MPASHDSRGAASFAAIVPRVAAVDGHASRRDSRSTQGPVDVVAGGRGGVLLDLRVGGRHDRADVDVEAAAVVAAVGAAGAGRAAEGAVLRDDAIAKGRAAVAQDGDATTLAIATARALAAVAADRLVVVDQASSVDRDRGRIRLSAWLESSLA